MSAESKQRWEEHKAKERAKFLIRKDLPLWNQMCKDYKSGELFKANRCLHYPEAWTDPIIDNSHAYLCRKYKVYGVKLKNLTCITCGCFFDNNRLSIIRYYYPVKGVPYKYEWLTDYSFSFSIKDLIKDDPLNNLICKVCGSHHRIWAKEPMQIRLARITINNIVRYGKENERIRT